MEHDGREGVPKWNLDESAAMLRYDSSSLDAMLRALVERLSGVPGLGMTVTHHQGPFRKFLGDIPYVNDLNRRSDPINSIVVVVGTTEYWLKNTNGKIHCGTNIPASPNGRVTTDKVFSSWAESLISDLTRENKTHCDAISALRDLTESGQL